jgi:hypothetical protein
MYGGSIAEFPYLFDSLEDEIGIHVECTADHIDIEPRSRAAVSHQLAV